MPAAWKTVRVFIFSTFREMYPEGEWLVKRVLPNFREKLQKYRIHLLASFCKLHKRLKGLFEGRQPC
jgi:hypothetical protein